MKNVKNVKTSTLGKLLDQRPGLRYHNGWPHGIRRQAKDVPDLRLEEKKNMEGWQSSTETDLFGCRHDQYLRGMISCYSIGFSICVGACACGRYF